MKRQKNRYIELLSIPFGIYRAVSDTILISTNGLSIPFGIYQSMKNYSNMQKNTTLNPFWDLSHWPARNRKNHTVSQSLLRFILFNTQARYNACLADSQSLLGFIELLCKPITEPQTVLSQSLLGFIGQMSCWEGLCKSIISQSLLGFIFCQQF